MMRKGAYVTRSWKSSSPKETIFNRIMPALHIVGSVALAGAGAVAEKARRKGAPALEGPLSSASWYPQARKLGLYFMSFSMVGHWVEMLFCTGIKYGIFKGGYDRNNHMLWDQWLFPFSAEGTALAAVVVFLHPVALKLQRRFGERSWKRKRLWALSPGASFPCGCTCRRRLRAASW